MDDSKKYNIEFFTNKIKSLLPKEINYSKLIEEFKKSNAYIAGGIINWAINQNINFMLPGDLDIYIHQKKESEILLNYLNKLTILEEPPIIKIINPNNYFSSINNNLLYKVKFKLNNGLDLDVHIIDDNISLHDFIMDFDIDFCSVYLAYSLKNEIFLGGNLNNVIKKLGNLNKKYIDKYILDISVIIRIKKYLSRGYNKIV